MLLASQSQHTYLWSLHSITGFQCCFSLSRDLRLMKPPAEAFIREHFNVSMFWGEHLHVLYTLNEKVPHGYSLSSGSSTGTPPRL